MEDKKEISVPVDEEDFWRGVSNNILDYSKAPDYLIGLMISVKRGNESMEQMLNEFFQETNYKIRVGKDNG